MSRDLLRRELWQEDTFVDFDQGLNFCISQIRAALGDTADSPRFVETLPRRGYRFIAPVQESIASSASAGPVATIAPPTPRRGTRWLAASAVIAAAAIAGVLWFRSPGRSPTAAGSMRAEPPRLVVLPFENLTGRPTDDWLAGAFSDTLTYGLQNLQGLILINRERIAELFAQQGLAEARRLDARAAQRLSRFFSVRYYVHGSYQLVGDEVKVVASLVDAESGQIRVQESVTDRLANILRVEDSLAAKFASSLAVGPLQPSSELTESIEAYRAFIQARSLYAIGSFDTALDEAGRATALDPKLAQAWAVMSKSYSRMTAPSTFAGGRQAEYRRRAFETAQRAVTTGPRLYDARTALALAHRENGTVEPWRSEARAAIDLNPSLAEAYALLADSYFSAPGWGCGRDRDSALAEKYYRRAVELDPRFALAYGNLAIHLVWAARPREALAAVDAGLSEIPINLFLLQTRAYVLERLDRLGDAETQIDEILKARKPTVQDLTLLATIDLRRGNRPRSAQLFEEALSRRRDTTTELATARGHFDANDFDGGLAELERAFTDDSSCVGWFQQSAAFADARKTPQVRAVVARFQR